MLPMAPRFAWYGAPAARYECFAWIGCALFQRARNATVTQGNGIFLMGGFGSGFWPQGNPPLQSVKGVFVKIVPLRYSIFTKLPP